MKNNHENQHGLLNGRRALITGSTRGIGLAIARSFLNEGSGIVINSEAEDDDALHAKELLRKYGLQNNYICADLSDRNGCAYLVSESVKLLGGLDVLVNCAAYVRMDSLDIMDDDEIGRILQTNLHGPLFTSKAALPYLVKAAAEGVESCIINIGSSSGIEGHDRLVAYSASKGGVHALTRALAHELRSTNVRCNAVIPGWIENAVPGDESDESWEAWLDYLKHCPMQRAGKTDEVASVVVSLASKKFSYVNAQLIIVDGGAI
jgi:NAD(P)-dependent dehydrogenase (short-subunit alcohol dehydrogenase family)